MPLLIESANTRNQSALKKFTSLSEDENGEDEDDEEAEGHGEDQVCMKGVTDVPRAHVGAQIDIEPRAVATQGHAQIGARDVAELLKLDSLEKFPADTAGMTSIVKA